MKKIVIFTIFTLLLTLQTTWAESSIVWAGARSSIYGAVPFPEDSSWGFIMKNMVAKNSAQIPCGIWIVGHLDSRNGNCFLEFEKPDTMTTVPDHVSFLGDDPDWNYEVNDHEATLNYFDVNGIKVMLQVEPGLADLPTLMDIVMQKYGHHESVIGFGFDIEWFNVPDDQNVNGGETGYENKVNYELASSWNNQLKEYNPNYQLFLKHWLKDYLAETANDIIDDILYIDDSQGFGYADDPLWEMEWEFADWASYFNPAPVGYQIGYEQDVDWWPNLDDPLENIAGSIKWAIDQNESSQKLGMFWVDFTLYHDSITEIWENKGYSNIDVPISNFLNVKNSHFSFNTVKNSIKINFKESDNIEINIYNLSGKNVKSLKSNNNLKSASINTSQLSKGCYIVKVKFNNHNYNQSLFIK